MKVSFRLLMMAVLVCGLPLRAMAAGEPETTFDSRPNGPTWVQNARFDFHGDDGLGPNIGIAGFECSLDGAPFSSCTSPATYSLLANGPHSFHVRALDDASNSDPTPASYTWLIDVIAPDTAIDSAPTNPSASPSANFTFTGADGDGSGVTSFRVSLDFQPYATAASPLSLTDLADGSHTLQVEAIDAVGLIDTTPATYTWVIDTAAPDTTITANPTAPSASSNANFMFTGSDSGGVGVAGFECQLDGGAFIACSSPQTYTGLVDGSHTFQVRAIDAAGNTDPTPASFAWVVDMTAPDTTITANPTSPSGSKSASFSFTGNDSGSGVVSFNCTFDGDLFADCTSPQTFTGLVDGSHTFSVTAIDGAGNADPTPATFTWLVDTVKPDTMITIEPSDPVASEDSTFYFTASEFDGNGIAGYECSLDGASFTACESPWRNMHVGQGSHTFQVRAYDPAGNVDETPASYSWTVDTTPPETSFVSTPAATGSSRNVSFSFSGNDGSGTGVASFQCSLNGESFALCTSPVTLTGLTEGSNSFQVRAIDAVGNTDESPATFTWPVDATPPETTIDSKPTDPSLASVSFEFSGSDGGGTGVGSFECQLDQGDFEACTSPKQFDGLTEGSHTFKVRAIDTAGNTDQSAAEYTWAVDLTGQDATISVGPAPGETTGPSVTFQFTATEDGGSFFCTVDSDAEVDCSSSDGFTASGLTDGLHTLSVVATDALGNRGSPQELTWTVDATPPVTTITSRPALISNATTVSFAFTTSEMADTYCSTDNQSFVLCTSPAEFPVATETNYTIYFRSTDVYGNEEPAAGYTFTIDRTPPETTITQATPERTLDATTTVEFTSNEANSTFLCQVNSDAPAACTSPFSVNTLPLGKHTIRITAIDAAGNADPTPATFVFTYTNDFDDDGLTEAEEATAHTDPTNADTDDDGVKDGIEVKFSHTDPLDDDSDDDGLKDGSEDANGNGKLDLGETDPKNPDTDDDGLTDGLELGLTAPEGLNTDMAKFKKDLDPTTKTDPTTRDTDGGGVFDGNEDANHNGKVDGKETDPNEGLDDVDADQDGLSNADEAAIGSDPKDADTDDDGVLDGYEGTADTDGDGTPDVLDLDSDNDGLPDGVEAGIAVDKARPGTNTNSPDFVPDEDPSTKTDRRNPDSDGDGIKDGDEDSNHNGRVDEGETDPSKADTDGDGMSDKDELDAGRNPLDASDGQPAPAAETKKSGCSTDGTNAGVLLAMVALAMQLRRRRLE